MAIQAQYPFLPNRNTHQQDKNTPFCVDDYTSMRLNNGASPFLHHTNAGVWTNDSTRKRGREEDNLLMSQQHPEFIGLRQLFSGHQNVVSTGLGLAFHNQQPHQSVSPQIRSLLSDEFVSQIKQQNDEIDHFIITQGEQMRRTLAEKRRRQYRTLLIAAEESASRRLREKEAEVAKAVRRHAELESKANQITLEAQAWQARARMQENYAAALQLQLQQAIVTGGSGGQVQDLDADGGGNSTAIGGEAEDAGSAYIDPDRVIPSAPNCKSCRNRVASVVLLPCRHLCLCSECDAVAQACPACLTVRSSSIQVLFS